MYNTVHTYDTLIFLSENTPGVHGIQSSFFPLLSNKKGWKIDMTIKIVG